MMTTTTRYEQGLAKLREVDGHIGEQVVANLADIAPDYEHPQTQKSVAQMLADVSSSVDEATTAVYRLPDQPNFMGT